MSENPNQLPNEDVSQTDENQENMEQDEDQSNDLNFVSLREECEAIFKVLAEVKEMEKGGKINQEDERVRLAADIQYQLRQSRIHLKEIHIPESAIVADLDNTFELFLMWRYTGGKPILTAHSRSVIPVTKTNEQAKSTAEVDHYLFQIISQEAIYHDNVLYLLDQTQMQTITKEQYAKMSEDSKKQKQPQQ